MEKIPNKYALIIRIICYILIPILIMAIMQSALSLLFFVKNEGKLKEENFFETSEYANLYKESIYNNIDVNYSYEDITGYVIEQYNYSNDSISIQQNEQGKISYLNYIENRNFKFLIIDNKTNVAITNLPHTVKTDSIEKIQQELASYNYYWNYEKQNVETNIIKLSMENIKYDYLFNRVQEYDCTIYTAMKAPLEHYDSYFDTYILYCIINPSSKSFVINLPISIMLLLLCIFLIGIYTGRKKGQEEVYLNWFDKLPLEIAGIFLLIFDLGALIFCINLTSNTLVNIIMIILFTSILYIMGMVSFETFIRRIKSHTLLKNTLIYRLYKATTRGIKNIYYNFSLAVKIVIAIISFIIITSICINSGFFGFIVLVVISVVVFRKIFSKLKQFLKIKQIIKEMYEGNTQVNLQEDEYEGVLKELCIYLNDIAGGFSNAIEKSLKSERMKTELITNVSHDIKTPLTSIINYVDLLKKEEMPNEKAQEYLEVLDQKSQRLKRLTEDLVEASKASSGNIKLNMEKLDVKELIKQVSRRIWRQIKRKEIRPNIKYARRRNFNYSR